MPYVFLLGPLRFLTKLCMGMLPNNAHLPYPEVHTLNLWYPIENLPLHYNYIKTLHPFFTVSGHPLTSRIVIGLLVRASQFLLPFPLSLWNPYPLIGSSIRNIPYSPSEGTLIPSQRGTWKRPNFLLFFFSALVIQRIIVVIIIIINIIIVIIIIVVVRSLSLFLLLNVHLSTFHMFLHHDGFLMRNYYLTLS